MFWLWLLIVVPAVVWLLLLVVDGLALRIALARLLAHRPAWNALEMVDALAAALEQAEQATTDYHDQMMTAETRLIVMDHRLAEARKALEEIAAYDAGGDWFIEDILEVARAALAATEGDTAE